MKTEVSMKGTYNAIYTYYTKDFFNNTLVKHTSQCVIVGETEKSYRIRLIEATFNRCPNSVIWVRKKSIQLRSYYNNETKICDIYELSPVEQSCCACIQRCERKFRLNNNYY